MFRERSVNPQSRQSKVWGVLKTQGKKEGTDLIVQDLGLTLVSIATLIATVIVTQIALLINPPTPNRRARLKGAARTPQRMPLKTPLDKVIATMKILMMTLMIWLIPINF